MKYLLIILIPIIGLILVGCNPSNINPVPPELKDNPYDGIVYIQSEECDEDCETLSDEFNCWDYKINEVPDRRNCECAMLYCKNRVEVKNER